VEEAVSESGEKRWSAVHDMIDGRVWYGAVKNLEVMKGKEGEDGKLELDRSIGMYGCWLIVDL